MIKFFVEYFMATASGKNRGFFFVFIQCRKLRKCVNSQRGSKFNVKRNYMIKSKILITLQRSVSGIINEAASAVDQRENKINT